MALPPPTFGPALWVGLKKDLWASGGVIKVMFPVTLMKVTPLLGWLAEIFRPAMGAFGLRGETALPFILGSVLNRYVAIGADWVVALMARILFTEGFM